ncbi:unnamed protein product [Arctogadus glacialis]
MTNTTYKSPDVVEAPPGDPLQPDCGRFSRVPTNSCYAISSRQVVPKKKRRRTSAADVSVGRPDRRAVYKEPLSGSVLAGRTTSSRPPAARTQRDAKRDHVAGEEPVGGVFTSGRLSVLSRSAAPLQRRH